MKGKIIVLSLLLVIIAGCSKDIVDIKESTLEACSDYTIEELVDNYMEDAKWEKTKGDNGYYIYSASGKILYNNELVEASIDFASSGSKIIVKGFRIDKTLDKKLVIDNLISNMCKVTKEKRKGSKEKDNIPKEIKEKISNLGENYTVFDLLVNKITSYGNSIFPGSHIDLYEIDNGNPKLILENVEVIATRTKTNSYDFNDVKTEKEWYLLLAIPKEMEDKLKYIKIYVAPTNSVDYGEYYE